MIEDQDAHALERTSPKGGPFIGRCWLCGKGGLVSPFDEMPCANPSGVSQNQSLIEAIEGPQKP